MDDNPNNEDEEYDDESFNSDDGDKDHLYFDKVVLNLKASFTLSNV